MKKTFLSLAAVTACISSFAHEGHGHTDGFTIKHYFTEPEHIIPVLLAAGVAVVLFRYFKKKEAK
jgi:hydrogenase/urease accessory protein HupE